MIPCVYHEFLPFALAELLCYLFAANSLGVDAIFVFTSNVTWHHFLWESLKSFK